MSTFTSPEVNFANVKQFTDYMDKHLGIAGSTPQVVAFDVNDASGTAGAGAIIGLLGDGDTVTLGASSVFWGWGNNDTVSAGQDSWIYSHDASGGSFTLAEGNVKPSIPYANGGGNSVAINGDDHVTVSVTNGAGSGEHATVQDYLGSGNTIDVSAGLGTTEMNFWENTSGDAVNLTAGGALTVRTDATCSDITANIGAAGGKVNWFGMASSDLVGLSHTLGFATATAAVNAVTSDSHGGSLLTFHGGLGKLDIWGVTPSALHASNFAIN